MLQKCVKFNTILNYMSYFTLLHISNKMDGEQRTLNPNKLPDVSFDPSRLVEIGKFIFDEKVVKMINYIIPGRTNDAELHQNLYFNKYFLFLGNTIFPLFTFSLPGRSNILISELFPFKLQQAKKSNGFNLAVKLCLYVHV